MSDLAVLRFGDFELSPRRRTLTQGGRRLRLGSRAMDILLLLASRPGDLVTKDEIQSHLWPGIFVDEASVRVHLSSLRKALGGGGADHIHTVAGRGYIFVSPVTRSAEPESQAAFDTLVHLPLRLERLIGRGPVVDSLAAQVLERRFVTVVGPGGIGKTSVALEVAARIADAFPDGVRFVDLSALEDPEAAPGALAIALGLPALSELSPASLTGPLAGKRLLIVLDNCERVVGTAAVVAEALLRSAVGVCVLATSREALRADGEWLHRLPPLATPTTAPATPSAALRYSAIELFVDRADAASGGYRLTAEDCPAVTEICRRLDGLPLAIELAATTVGALGVRGVAAGLDDRLALLTAGKRTAQSRHQTLRAALDWSYDRLDGRERALIDRLSVVAGGFDLALAEAIAGDLDLGADEIRAIVTALTGKSLIAVETGGLEVRYRLLESTRAYTGEKLVISAAKSAVMRRYARATLAFFGATRDWAEVSSAVWLDLHGSRLEDARVVLDWAFSDAGDAALARRLTAELSDVWLHIGLVRECVSWCQKALVAPGRDGLEADADELRIRHAYRIGFGFKYGNDPSKREGLADTIAVAERLDDHDYVMRGLWSLASLELNDGRLPQAVVAASQLRDAASGRQAAAERLVGERMLGSALHLMGRHAEAREILEQVRAAYGKPGMRASAVRFQFDQLVLAQGFLAWITWMEGDEAGAQAAIEEAVAEAAHVGHAGSLGFALDSAITLAILRSDLPGAETACHRLGEMGANVGYDIWMTRSEILHAIIQVRSGDLVGGVPRLQASLKPAHWKMATYRTPLFLAELARAEAAAGLPERALGTIDDAIAWYRNTDDFWCAPECLRIKAEILRLHGGANATREAEALLARAFALADAQGAVAWRRRVQASCGDLQPASMP